MFTCLSDSNVYNVFGPMAVECLGISSNPVYIGSEVSNLIIELSCATDIQVHLYDYVGNSFVQLSDPKNLVESNNNWIVDSEGATHGIFRRVFGKNPCFSS